jgi:hypothetical protein
MITGFVIATGLPPTRERANINRGFTVHAQAFDLLRVLSPVVFFSRVANLTREQYNGLPSAFLRV